MGATTAGPGGGRPFSEVDWALVRRLLVDVLPRSAPGFTWEVRRWDGWRWYRPDPTWDPALERTARVWEAPDGSPAGVAHADGDGQLAIQVDPAHRYLEPEMLAWAEGSLAAPDGAGGRQAGTTQACVDTGSGEAANQLYADVGFGEVFVERAWEWRGPTA